MSAKWRRNLAWDDEFFPARAWPVKFLLRMFSSIPLAVVLLSLVVVYATLASVPIGLIAQVPTYVIMLATLVTCSILPGALVAWGLRKSEVGASRLAIAGGALAMLVGAGAWYLLLYPLLRYDWGTGQGFMLFAGFCETYSSTTLRRLPVLEMSEVEFYSWWPLRIILILFVANMITATLRRIEFKFVNIGVLSVHTGIVLLAFGSMYYGSMKQEGDALLIAGPATATGHMTPGPWEEVYYDALLSALHVRTPGRNWLQLPLSGVPRYNDYNIEASVSPTLFAGIEEALRQYDDGERTLDIKTEPVPKEIEELQDLQFRAIGYVAYAADRSATDFIEVDLASLRSIPRDFRANPIRMLEITVPFTNERGERELRTTPLMFLPRDPAGSLVQLDGLTVEYAMNRRAERTRDLLEPVPDGVRHALLIEADGHRQLYPLGSDYSSPTFNVFQPENAPASETVVVGETGFAVDVLALLPEPPLQIVTPGYEGATSSMALLRVRKIADQEADSPDVEPQPSPDADNAELVGPAPDPVTPSPDDTSSGAYTRWVYSRFPEISQDFLQDRAGTGRPARRDADPEIRVTYIDLAQVRFFLNENSEGEIDLIVRAPDGEITRFEKLGSHEGHANLIRVVQKWEHAEKFERPIPVPRHLQEADRIGTHDRARLAIEVTSTRHEGWKRIVWLPFSRYLDRSTHSASDDDGPERWVRTPDGRAVELTFGRYWRRFRDFEMRLLDFQMIEYAHRGAPRDYQSTVEVFPRKEGAFEPFSHTAKLNAPLRAPFNVYDKAANPIAMFFGRLLHGLNPNQFKLSQSGWDPTTWEQTRAAVDRGELERPFVGHTILHVGNNPGIHVIALGGILMAVGIPWAFYVKPWLLRRKKVKIQRQIRDGTYSPPKIQEKSIGRIPEGAST